jgi:hypothetical protein
MEAARIVRNRVNDMLDPLLFLRIWLASQLGLVFVSARTQDLEDGLAHKPFSFRPAPGNFKKGSETPHVWNWHHEIGLQWKWDRMLSMHGRRDPPKSKWLDIESPRSGGKHNQKHSCNSDPEHNE